MKRKEILEKLRREVNKGNYIIGVVTGSGMTAKYSQVAGADFLLMLNSGRFRHMGRSSLAGYLPFCNSNDMVMEFAYKEIMPLVKNIPVIFGVNATDPTKNIDILIEKIIKSGFSGVSNYPTIGLIDGKIREAFEEAGFSYSLEVELIKKAHDKDLYTVAFVFDEIQAEQMVKAGADIICLHLGLTQDSLLRAEKVFSLENAKIKMEKIFCKCNELNPHVIKLVYGGPIKTPGDIQYLYGDNDLMGYIGELTFERIQFEKLIIKTIRNFKLYSTVDKEDITVKMLNGIVKHYDYVEFVKEYVSKNYMNNILLTDLAKIAHVSRSYLSTIFKKEVGCTFSQYLVSFRINKAVEILNKKDIPLSTVALLVGYKDYAQFSKMFKKYKGYSPIEHKHKNIEHKNVYNKNEKD